MIIIDSQFTPQTTPLTMCIFNGDSAATAFIIGAKLVKSTPLPELNSDGLWVTDAQGIIDITVIRIFGKLYFESSSVSTIEPGKFILNTETNQLFIKPYETL